MEARYHSVTLDKERCRGCSNCLLHCPTQAIRVRGGRAHIIKELCIDCGNCIRVCAYHAKVAMTDGLDSALQFEHKIALPAPSFFAQFAQLKQSPGQVIDALKDLGFDEVFEVAIAADVVTRATKRLLADRTLPRPLISSACPTITRLIQVRFPTLIKHILPLRQPMEIAAHMARKEYCEKHGLSPKEVGVFFITPCPAKMTAIRSPIGQAESQVDGAIAMTEAYGAVLPHLKKHRDTQTPLRASRQGMGWAATGGEAEATGNPRVLSVDGIDNVIAVLEEVENGKLTDVNLLECAACSGGCVGGPLAFDNNYVATNTLRQIGAALPPQQEEGATAPGLFMDQPILPNEQLRLDENLDIAIEKLSDVNTILERLPGYDCGSCGSPTCRAFAEDIVQGYCVELDCIYLLKDRLKLMAQQMVDLSQTSRE